MSTNAIAKKSSWWPKLIIATYAFFILFIGNMVRQAVTQDIDLVSKDYYQKEIAYQDHINQVEATQALKDQVLLNFAPAAEQFSIVFPASLTGQELKGEVLFFRPSSAKQDFIVPLALNSDGQQHISTAQMGKGLWKVKVNWSQGEGLYYLEKNITIQ